MRTEELLKENVQDPALIREIIELEWKQFDRVNNEGGRAGCQDDWDMFYFMRSAQFAAWPVEILHSYLVDLKEAEMLGNNLIEEKYARMMASTAPEQYAAFCHLLPERTEERRARQEETIRIQVLWEEQLVARYPHYGAHGRLVHTSEDTPWATSVETYARGEISTYSDETYDLYEKWIQSLREEGVSLAEKTAEFISRGYGYPSLDAAEERMAAKENK